MAMLRALMGLVVIALCVGGLDRAAADHVKDGRTVHRIVVQVNEDNPQLWNLTLNNIANLIGAMGKEHVDIKVIAYGPGINMFKKDRSNVLDRLDSLKKFAGPSVGYTVCSNTMKAMHVERQDIVELVDDFYPGIVRVVELQEKGYVYLRP
jgi:intracellular sulfur oxidation DsrE/DsrF family protein